MCSVAMSLLFNDDTHESEEISMKEEDFESEKQEA